MSVYNGITEGFIKKERRDLCDKRKEGFINPRIHAWINMLQRRDLYKKEDLYYRRDLYKKREERFINHRIHA